MSVFQSLLHSHSPLRIFFFSSLITILVLIILLLNLGPGAMVIAGLLVIIEITFSFENAIINARVLTTLSIFWQRMFLTVGILIAIFGMRIVFPIVVVMLTAGLDWTEVVNLAIHEPDRYAYELEHAHISIAAFGGFFLAMLGFHYFFNPAKRAHWWHVPEKLAARFSKRYTYVGVVLALLLIVCAFSMKSDIREIVIAGAIGIGLYLLIHGLAERFSSSKALTSGVNKAGMAGFLGFMYLEVLDASFSIDSVIGAFAITDEVILIAAGLGVGAIWVRSLTVFMVRRGTLKVYRYLEHGAHYTILALASILLLSLFIKVPEMVAGLIGIVLITISIVASVKFNKLHKIRF